MNLAPKDLKSVLLGLELYKSKLKKTLKQTDEVKVGEKDVKQAFLDTEALINRLNIKADE